MAQKKIKLFLSVRWWQRFTNERWERLIRTDALLSKAGVSCRRTCPVSYYSWQGSGEGMGNDENDFIILVYDRNNLYFSDCMHYMTQPRSQDSLLPAPMERERERETLENAGHVAPGQNYFWGRSPLSHIFLPGLLAKFTQWSQRQDRFDYNYNWN